MKIKIRKSFLIYLILMLLLSSPATVLAILAALAAHEFGHIAAGRIVGEPMTGFELTPFGGILHCESGKSSLKGVRGIVTAASGPAANYLFLRILYLEPVKHLIDWPMTKALTTANVSMLLLNLLPVLPLDGGRIILSVGFYLMNTSLLINTLSFLGCLVGVSLVLFALYGLVSHGILNCSLMIIGVYMTFSAYLSGTALIYENAFAIIRERRISSDQIQKTQCYSAGVNTRVIDLVPIISRVPAALIILRDENKLRIIPDQTLFSAILKTPSATLGEISGIT